MGAPGLAFEAWDPSNRTQITSRSPLCHPERTRISYFTALTGATDVVLLKENHMRLIEAAILDRKSGGAEGPAVRLSSKQTLRELAPPPPLPYNRDSYQHAK